MRKRGTLCWLVLVLAALACRSGTTGRADEASVAAEELQAAGELRRGIALVEQGDFEAGIEVLRTVLSMAPDDRELVLRARCWLVTALTSDGDPEGALRECLLALEITPEDPWLHYACGVARYKMGELDLALESFTHAIEHDPRHIKGHQWRGRVLLDLGDYRAAVDDLTRALACIESADESTLVSWDGDRRTLTLKTLDLRIRAYDRLGRHDEAMRDRERYSQIFDGSVPTTPAGPR